MKKLELININKSYERNIPVLKDVSFSVDSGDFLVLLGPSGSGKSTILSIIAGFEQQDSGDIIIDGRNCNKESCKNRDIAMVFQNYALYPSMNVYNNIAFPLVNKHEKKDVIAKRNRAVRYCDVVNVYAEANGLKKWKHLFIPAKEIKISSSFNSFAQRFVWNTEVDV